MNTDEVFEFLDLKEEELRKLYLDLLEENVKLKKELEKRKMVLRSRAWGRKNIRMKEFK